MTRLVETLKTIHKMSSQAEVQALEELVRNNSDAVRQFKYDIKEIERVASGGY